MKPAGSAAGAGLLAAIVAAAGVVAAPAVAAQLAVTTLADLDLVDGDCSLREAIHAANDDSPYGDCPAGEGDDRIELTLPGTIVLTASLPLLGEGLTVAGLAASESGIDGGGLYRIFSLPGPANGATDRLRLERLHLADGRAASGGAVAVGAGRSLELVDCVIEGSVAEQFGGAAAALNADSVWIERSVVAGSVALGRDGGGVAVTFANRLEIVDSTLAGNSAAVGSGGGLLAYLVDQVTIRRSTISGNVAGDHGGGIEQVGGTGELAFATVVDNRADTDDEPGGWGGGIDLAGVGGSLTLVDSVVAGNLDASPDDADCPDLNERLTADLLSGGFNLIGIHGCVEGRFPAGFPNGNGDFVGTPDDPLDAGLSGLGQFGGPTPTHRPAADSPLLDRGGCPGELADQRGWSDPTSGLRIVDVPSIPDFADGCDIGAVERHPDPLPDLPFADGFETGDTSRWSGAVEGL